MSASDTEDLESVIDQLYIGESDSKWRNTISEVVKSVVSVHFMIPVAFDTEMKESAQATGFIVDAERGIILTNRHVVCPGPFVGYAVLDNHEEVEVTALYRDPVHDFGFLKFKPSDIKHMEVKGLPLCPERARVGEEIRVIGNDSGEKLSILSGVISRMDRNAPDYGIYSYNDFNTEYIQAAASASGGSSGSPVVNISGETVALQAGGSDESSTDFFLPIWRVRRALKCLQDEVEITRGTIQVQWTLEPFDTCNRLGLTTEAEGKMRPLSCRDTDVNGMLVCKIALPKGPADGSIMEGDCLISINDTLISSFMQVDEIFDSNVGKEVEIVVQRSGVDIKNTLVIQNLHDITPNQFVEVCGSTFHNLSYQMARICGTSVSGVYVSYGVDSFQLGEAGYMTSGWLIEALDNKPTPDLNAFVEVMKNIPDKAYVTVKYYATRQRNVPLFKDICIDRHSSKPIKIATRNDATGFWDYTVLQAEPIVVVEQKPGKAKIIDLATEFEVCKGLNKSFVLVEAKYRVALDYCYANSQKRHGIVIDAGKGLVLISRNCVVNDLCDVSVTIAESVVLPATVIFLHPTKCYAIVKYDPTLVDADITTPKFDSTPLARNEKLVFYGFDPGMRLLTDRARVVDNSLTARAANTYNPSYKPLNIDAVVIDSLQAQKCSSGVLCCPITGTIRAIWSLTDGEYHSGNCDAVDVSSIMWELEDFLNGKTEVPNVRVLDAELTSISLAEARISGVPDELINELEETAKDKYQLLRVLNVAIDFDSKFVTSLRSNDVILKANDKLITNYRDIEETIRQTPLGGKLSMCVVREKQLINVDVELQDSDRDDEMFVTKKLVSWAGCSLQCPHQAIRQVLSTIPSQIYCTIIKPGSPASFYSFEGGNFITHINDVKVQTIDDFVIEAKKVKDGTYVKLRTVSFDHIPAAITLKVCYHYFKTTTFTRIDVGKWVNDS